MLLRFHNIIFLALFIYRIKAEINSFYYERQQNFGINSTINKMWLLGSIYKESKLSCLSHCNSNLSCMNIVYDKASKVCSIYSKCFNVNDVTGYNGSELNIKRG